MSAEKTVFISYRRQPASFIARAIYQDLRVHGYDVFMDIESIDSGTFDTIILNQIAARQHFLVILTPGTLERCNEPDDWLRREVEYAIEKRRNIVPLLVNDFKLNNYHQYLTGNLAELARFSGINVPHDYFEEAMTRLRTRFLVLPMQGRIENPSPQEQHIIQQRQAQVDAQPAPTEKQLTAEHYFSQALEHQNNGRLVEAMRDYNEALSLNPASIEGYNNRGNIRKAQGDLEGAITDYNEAIRLNPQYTLAYNNRGLARKVQGDLEGAIADFNQAIRINPGDDFAYNNRGNIRADQGDLVGAMADYTEAIRFNPQYADAYNNRGTVRQIQQDLVGAMADYTEAIRFNPQYADAYYNRGLIYYEQNDYAHAIVDYTEAIRINPRYADVYKNRGLAYEQQGNLNAALADFESYLAFGGGQQNGDQKVIEDYIEVLKKRL